MREVLSERAKELSRLAAKIRTSLDEAESTVPGINEQLNRLAETGVTEFQIEGPTVYCRPMGVSSAFTDDFVVYQAAIVMPGGVGAVIWDANEYHEHANRPPASQSIWRRRSCLMSSARRSCGHCLFPTPGGCSTALCTPYGCSARDADR